MNYFKRIFSNKPDNNIIQFLRYGIASAVAFLFDFLLLAILVESGMAVLISNIISFMIGLSITYVFSITWVFTGSKRKSKYIEFLLFTVVGILAMGVNELILFVFYVKVGFHHLIAKIIAAGVTVLFNYILRKTLLFSKKINGDI